MKNTLSIIVLTCMLALFTAGCSSKAPQNQPQSQSGESITQSDAGIATQTANPGNADTSSFIGEDKAKEIALSKAGLSTGDVIFDRVELDRDNGVWQYEVEFRQGRTEYDADIKADDGTVISWETDYDD